jgi:hypothetical protein
MTRVPLGRKGAISNRAPIIEARNRMVRSPSPGVFLSTASMPPPSSQTQAEPRSRNVMHAPTTRSRLSTTHDMPPPTGTRIPSRLIT